MSMNDLIPALVKLCDESPLEVSAYGVVRDLRESMDGGDNGGWLPEYHDLLTEAELVITEHTDAEADSDAMYFTLDELLDAMDDSARNAND